MNFFLQTNQDKLVLVKFFTTWCLPCQELQKNLEDLLRERKDLLVLEVDAEKFSKIAQSSEFAVRSVPTLFLFYNGPVGEAINTHAFHACMTGIYENSSTFKCGGVVQLVEHRPSDPIVVGSSPATSASLRLFAQMCGIGRRVLWYSGNTPPCHGGVAGSIPVRTAIFDREKELKHGDVIYRLTDKKSSSGYYRCKNDAISRYIYDKPSFIDNASKERRIKYSKLPDLVDCVISKDISGIDGKLDIKIQDKSASGSPVAQAFTPKVLKMFIEFGKNDTIEADEIITFPSPSPNKDKTF
ncbi:11518_t:CDS:2 [Ambispora leptoticha]|uniref:11518_t:CDS:1 n=1 Tax=Ambispora leptoticha TaxID=144679 RepID=A0A9N8V557_9GLOM|nr:11518_t:CDS:2 [Ambispora leptoticha]